MSDSMRAGRKISWWLIILTFFLAFLLTILPMPTWTIWLRPAWIVMVLVYWIHVQPLRIGVGVAWLMGLFLDVFCGTLLGEHALAMTIVAFIAVSQRHRFLIFPLFQQSLGILLIVFAYQFILFCTQGFLGELPINSLYWLAPVTSMLLWPWVYVIIQDSQRRFRFL